MILSGTLTDTFDGTEYLNQIYGTLGNPSYGTMYGLDEKDLSTIIQTNIYPDVIYKVEKRLSNIVLKDYFPSDIINNCTVSNIHGAGSVDTSTLESDRYITWNLGTLADGYVATLEYTIKINDMKNSPLIGKTIATNEKVEAKFAPHGSGIVLITMTESPIIKLNGWESLTFSKQSNITSNTVVEGQEITYSLSASNSGNMEATAWIQDTAPTGTTFIENSITVNNSQASYTLSDLSNGINLTVPPKATTTLTFKVIVNKLANGTKISNTAKFKDVTTPDNIPSETPKTVELEYLEAVLNTVKTSKTEFNKNYIVAGEKITYTIAISNSGGLAKDVVVKDPIPTGTTFVDGSIKWNGSPLMKLDGTFLNSQDLSNGITLNIPANTSNQLLTFEVVVGDLNNGDKVQNTAYVDDTPISEESSHDYMEPIISSVKTSKTEFDKDYVVAGEKITYTIAISNSGSLGKDVVVKDPIPSGTTLVDGSIKWNGSPLMKQDGTALNSQDLTNGITLNIPANTLNHSLTFEVFVGNIGNGNKIQNTAYVDDTPVPEESSHDYMEPIINTVKTSKTEFNKDYIVAGEKITYTIAISNSGSLGKEINVRDPIPTGTTLVDGSIKWNGSPLMKQDGTALNNQDLANGINLNIPANTSNQLLTFEVVVGDLNNGDKIQNTAYVDDTPVPEESSHDYMEPIISTVKTSKTEFNKDYIVAGEKITYTISISNSGSLGKDVVVKDPIPNGTTLVDGSIKWNGSPLMKQDGTALNAQDLKNGIALNIPANTLNQFLTFEVIVGDIANGDKIQNTVYVDGVPTSEESPRNYVEAIINTVKTSKTEFNKDYIMAGEKITYMLDISNSGGLGKDIVIKDPIPTGTTFATGSIKWNGSPLTKQDGTALNAQDLTNGITLNIPAKTENQILSFDVIVGKMNVGEQIQNTAYVDDNPVTDKFHYTYAEPVITGIKTATTQYEKEYVVAGEKITYSIMVLNNGNLEKNVVIRDVLSDMVTFVEGSLKVNDEVYKDASGKLLGSSDLANGIEVLVPAKNEEGTAGQAILSFEVIVNKLPSDDKAFTLSNVATIDGEPTNSSEYTLLPFNMKIEKKIKSYTVDGQYNDDGNDKLRKIEIVASTIPNAKVKITYSLIVTNTGKLPGTATIQDIIPDGFEVDADTPSYWTTNSSGNLETTTDVIEPGESKEFPVVLVWKNSSTNFGEKTNKASIVSASDGSSDITISSGETSEEDDYSEATVLMSIKTGILSHTMLIIILLLSASLLVIGAIVIKKKVLKK